MMHSQIYRICRYVVAGVSQCDSLLLLQIAEDHFRASVVQPFTIAACQPLQKLVVGLVVLYAIGDYLSETWPYDGVDVVCILIEDIICDVLQGLVLKGLACGVVLK